MEKNLDELKNQQSKQISQHNNCDSSLLQQNSSCSIGLQEESGKDNDNDNNNNNNTTTINIIVDNPCWGSPNNCSMKHLLRLVTKEIVILYESFNYLVINKPPDLRMDGNYPATLLKLLLYWYPSPSLLLLQQQQQQQQINNNYSSNLNSNNNIKGDKFIDSSNNNNTQSIHVDSNKNNYNVDYSLQLLNTISTINNYSDVYDNEIRPCHQLDYATSGVLLVARNQNAANVARISFENRLVTKRYVAIVDGHISQSSYIADAIKQNTILTTQQLTLQMSTIEKDYRKSRNNNKRKRNTFAGYLPPHSLFQQWQSQQKQQNRKAKPDANKIHKLQPMNEENSCNTGSNTQEIDSMQIENSTNETTTITETKTKKRSNITILTNDDWIQVWDHLYQRLDNNMIQSIIGCTWNQTKIISNDKWSLVRESFQLAAKTYNEILSSKIHLSNPLLSIVGTTTTNSAMGNIPMIFNTIDNDDNDDAVNNNSSIDNIIRSLNVDNTTTTTTMNTIQSNKIKSFYIASPIAEPTNPNTFQMIVPESYVDPTICPQLLTNKKSVIIDKQQQNNNTTDTSTINDKDLDFDFKPSLTKCWIIDETYIDQNENSNSSNHISNNNNDKEETKSSLIPVTYVILEPKTGRRHQLRVHTALIGHPIVGDQSYSRTKFIRSSFVDNSFSINNTNDSTLPKPTTSITRTCLHSLSLSIPVADDDDNDNDNNITNGNKDDDTNNNGTSTTCRSRRHHLTVSSQSPFQSYLSKSGRKLLRISLF